MENRDWNEFRYLNQFLWAERPVIAATALGTHSPPHRKSGTKKARHMCSA